MDNNFIIYGSDDFAVKKRTSELLEEAKKSFSEDAIELIEGDGKFDEVINNLISAIQTPAFLTPNKLVYLRNFHNLDTLTTASELAEIAVKILIEELPSSVKVIISAPNGSLDLKKSASKKLKKSFVVEKFEPIKISDKNYQMDRQNLIREKVNEANKTISNDAIRYMAETLSSDAGILFNELEKIFIYLGDENKITLEVCEKLCAKTPESISYLFTGALIEKDLKTSLILLAQLINAGEVEIKLMATISGELQKLVQTHAAMAELKLTNARINPRSFDAIPSYIREDNPNNFLLKLHPYRAFKMCESATKWSIKDISFALKIAASTNLKIVSGTNPRMALEQLVVKICMGA